MATKLENKKWIEIYLFISVTAKAIRKVKETYKSYAEELPGKWAVEVDKEGTVHESGVRIYETVFEPKGRKISPETFRKSKDKLYGFASEIYDWTQGDDGDGTWPGGVEFRGLAKDKSAKEVYIIHNWGDVFFIKYRAIDRLQLEQESPDMAKFLFGEYLYDWFDDNIYYFPWYEKLFRKEKYEAFKEQVKLLDDKLGIKLER